jgi:putative ABC transport system permease protein
MRELTDAGRPDINAGSWFEHAARDVRYALRMLRRTPGFTAVAVLSLALGIGANAAIFTILNAVFLNPLPVQDASHLAQIFTRDTRTIDSSTNFTLTGISLPNYEDFRDQNSVFANLAAFTFANVNWSGKAEPEQMPALVVTANYFDVLGVKAFRGRTFLPEEDKKPGANAVAVLSHSLWTRRFGADPNLIGQNITLNAQPYTVIGVAPPNFKGTFSLGGPDLVWVPISMRDQLFSGIWKQYSMDRRFRWLNVFGRLKPGMSLRQAEAAMKTIAAALEKQFPRENQGRTVALTLLSDAALGINQRRQFTLAGGVLMSVVGLVLLIACVNLANLLLARASRREKEMGIRVALGARRTRLVRQLLTESIVLALAGGAAGLLLAFWFRSVLWSYRPPFLLADAIDLSLDARVLAFTGGVSVLTGLLFGIVPAIQASDPDLNEILKVGGRGGTLAISRNPLRSSLVITEVALALVALAGAGLFLRSMANAQSIDPGFEPKKLFVFGFDLASQRYEPERGHQFFRDAIERAKAVSGVQAAAVASNAPLGGAIWRTTFHEGEQDNPNYRGTIMQYTSVTPGYFETMRIPLRRGRDFNDFDREDTTLVAIVTEAMAKHFWPGADPIGKRFSYYGSSKLLEVVGVVGDSMIQQIGEDPQPAVYLSMRQNYEPASTLLVRTIGDPETVLGTVRTRIQQLDRNLALTNVQTIGKILDQGLWAPRMGAALLGVFGLLALVLASVGIYGVMAYSVSQRTNEIGIRMALGAQRRGILGLVMQHGLVLTLTGVIGGLVCALALARLLGSLLFGVSSSDPATFAGVSLLLVAVALVACYVPARRAMRVDPIIALRYE